MALLVFCLKASFLLHFLKICIYFLIVVLQYFGISLIHMDYDKHNLDYEKKETLDSFACF